ncbi:MAG: hypothetical protein II651_04570, partial [Selenomonas sp.]|nr:hypothetical protein [Selenomonas sp.]
GNEGAGIGSGKSGACDKITISGGTVKATGGTDAAGIGSGTGTEGCGAITISGGTVTATGGNGNGGAGIGTGNDGSCGNITITTGVTKVTATKGSSADNSIGKATNHGNGNCGTVTIGGVVGAISTSPYTYDPNAPVYTMLSAATSSDCGKVVCAAGHLHLAKTAVPSGCTAVGILGKVTATGHGLILALNNASSQTWNTINGWTSVTTYAGTTLKQLPDDAARGANLTSYTTLGSTTVSNWAMAQKSDYEAIFTNLGSTAGNEGGRGYDANVNAYITTGVGGTAMSSYYWSASEDEDGWGWQFWDPYWNGGNKSTSKSLRPVLGF